MRPLLFDASFWNALVVMVADKAIIGVAVALIVYVAQRRLEAFRNEQALQKEIAKKRVESLASGWQALNAWDLAVTNLIAKFAGLLKKRLLLDDEAGLDELGLPDIGKIADWLSCQLKENAALIVEIRQDCQLALQPLVQKSIECANAAKDTMQENRFWFGQELYEHCKHFHAALHQVCVSFEKRDFQALPNQLRLLERKRANVLVVLQTVQTLPPRKLHDEAEALEFQQVEPVMTQPQV
jgi:hypothetical protein